MIVYSFFAILESSNVQWVVLRLLAKSAPTPVKNRTKKFPKRLAYNNIIQNINIYNPEFNPEYLYCKK